MCEACAKHVTVIGKHPHLTHGWYMPETWKSERKG